jgi:ribA/ribD-fused uncharacterized protein
MMAAKARTFNDHAMVEAIQQSSTPAEAKQLGRAVSNFDRDRWSAVRFDLVVKGNIAKFSRSRSTGSTVGDSPACSGGGEPS